MAAVVKLYSMSVYIGPDSGHLQIRSQESKEQGRVERTKLGLMQLLRERK